MLILLLHAVNNLNLNLNDDMEIFFFCVCVCEKILKIILSEKKVLLRFALSELLKDFQLNHFSTSLNLMEVLKETDETLRICKRAHY